MRLSVRDYRHPGETLTLIASVWLAITLLLLAEVVMLGLIIVRPFFAPLSLLLGVALFIIFHAGLALGLSRIGPHVRGLRAASRRAGPTGHPDVHEAAEKAAGRIAAPGTPPVYIVPVHELDSFTISWDRPEIFISQGLAESLGPLELRAALAHELAHLKGHHARLLTLVRLPLSAELAPGILLVPFALAWLALRWWASVAELSADRAAAIAAGGAEPVARWLSAVMSDQTGGESLTLHRYFTHAPDEPAWELAREQLHELDARVGRRVVELARFAASRKFANCLGIIGDLRLPAIEDHPDPSAGGLMAHVTIGMLAGLWLTPITIALTVALGAPQSAAFPPVAVDYVAEEAPPVSDFDPQAAPVPAESAPTDPGSSSGPVSLSGADAIEGMLEMARIHKDRGEYALARRMLEDLLNLDPTVAEAHFLLAWTWIGLGEQANAVQEFTATANLTEPGDEMHEEAVAALKRLGGGG